MKKYRVTEKHPQLKEGITSSYTNGGDISFRLVNNNIHRLGEKDIIDNIKKGWIEEIQEPEYTKSDLLDFACYFNINIPSDMKFSTPDSMIEFVDSWIKWRNK
jgi:hypothetical protein